MQIKPHETEELFAANLTSVDRQAEFSVEFLYQVFKERIKEDIAADLRRNGMVIPESAKTKTDPADGIRFCNTAFSNESCPHRSDCKGCEKEQPECKRQEKDKLGRIRRAIKEFKRDVKNSGYLHDTIAYNAAHQIFALHILSIMEEDK